LDRRINIKLCNIDAAKELSEKMPYRKRSDQVISSYFKKYTENTDIETVVIKVVLVNSLYSANLMEPLRMACHIANIKGLDEELVNGNPSIVDSIANLGSKHYIAFASKYAYFHNKDSFPICDSFIISALKALHKRINREPYVKFFQDIGEFRRQHDLSSVPWDDLDTYLWLYGQKKALDNNVKKIGNEVRKLYKDNMSLFERLEPDIVTGAITWMRSVDRRPALLDEP